MVILAVPQSGGSPSIDAAISAVLTAGLGTPVNATAGTQTPDPLIP